MAVGTIPVPPPSSIFLSSESIARAISEIVDIAKRGGIRVALAGGAALHLYGSGRLTKNVDFLAKRLLHGITTGSCLPFGGIAGGSPSGVPVNIIVRDDKYQALYGEALGQSIPMEMGVDIVRPEHLVAMKMVARRIKDESDLTTLILSGNLDLPLARSIIQRHLGPYGVDRFHRCLDEAEWRRSRGGNL